MAKKPINMTKPLRRSYVLLDVPELNFVPEIDKRGTSTSPEGVLTNKIFKYMGEEKGGLLYHRLLDKYGIDGLVSCNPRTNRRDYSQDVRIYDRFDTSAAEPQRQVPLSMTEMRRAVMSIVDAKNLAPMPDRQVAAIYRRREGRPSEKSADTQLSLF